MTTLNASLMKNPCDDPQKSLFSCVVCGIAGFFRKLDVDTWESLYLIWHSILAVAVIVLSARIIATPPPLFQGFALVLPAPMWSGLILIATGVQWYGRRATDSYCRYMGATCNFYICAMMCLAIWLKAPGLCFVVVGTLVPQGFLANILKVDLQRDRAKAARLCEEAKRDEKAAARLRLVEQSGEEKGTKEQPGKQQERRSALRRTGN